MTYRVIFQRLAVQDLDDAFVCAARKAPATAARWLDRFQAALQGLDANPQRCPRAREQRMVDTDLLEILFGKTPSVYRVIFVIDGDTVRVLRIRRAQRRALTRKQIDDASEQDKPERDGKSQREISRDVVSEGTSFRSQSVQILIAARFPSPWPSTVVMRLAHRLTWAFPGRFRATINARNMGPSIRVGWQNRLDLILAAYYGDLYIGVADGTSIWFLSSSSTSVFRIVVNNGEPTRHETQDSAVAIASKATITRVFRFVANRKRVTSSSLSAASAPSFPLSYRHSVA